MVKHKPLCHHRISLCGWILSSLVAAVLLLGLISLHRRPHEDNTLYLPQEAGNPELEATPSLQQEPEDPDIEFEGGDRLSVCSTAECVHASSRILQSMDVDVDPCDDFYEFACGKFMSDESIPIDEVSVNSFKALEHTLTKNLHKLLEAPISATDTKPTELAKTFYAACMNKVLAEDQELEEIMELLASCGGFPVLQGSSWVDTEFDWKDVTHCLRNEGLPFFGFIALTIRKDLQDHSKRVVHMLPGIALYSLEELKDNEQVKRNLQLEVDISRLLGANDTTVEDDINNAAGLYLKLVELLMGVATVPNSSAVNEMTIDALQKLEERVPWLQYITSVLGDKELTEKSSIVVYYPQYFTKLLDILETTPKRTQASFIFGFLMSFLSPALPEDVQNLRQKYLEETSGQVQRRSRRKECLYDVSKSLPVAITAMYDKKYFITETQDKAITLIMDIFKKFGESVENIDWMPDAAKGKALKKIEYLKPVVGNSAELLNDETVTKHYEGLELHSDKFVQSLLNILKFYMDNMSSQLKTTGSANNWRTLVEPISVNIRYDPSANTIRVPEGLIKAPMYSSKLPNYMNYAALGYVFAQELVHSVDAKGKNYDYSGHPKIWWDKNCEKAYKDRAQCFVAKYSKYKVEGSSTHVDGEMTLTENIADDSALALTYVAYNTWVSQNWQEARLIGLEKYSPNQMFWLTAAQTQCSLEREQLRKSLQARRMSAPARYRVNGPISNSNYFDIDFQCKRGKPMNGCPKCKPLF